MSGNADAKERKRTVPKGKTNTASAEIPEQEPARTLPPAWWGWPEGRGPGDGGTVLAGRNGWMVRAETDALLHRGIGAGEFVWVNPDRPPVPDEVVLAELPRGQPEYAGNPP